MSNVAWNKGLTKYTNPSVKKISSTMKKKGLDNFALWRKQAKQKGILISHYYPFEKNGDLAELIGVILGDGNIGKFQRTESLTIVANANNPGFIKRYTLLIKKIFNRDPSVRKRKNSNAVDIRIYQKFISKRLGIPTGAKRDIYFSIPRWILSDKEHIIRYLRGLYEAEGSISHHQPTYTHKCSFSNINKSLLYNVYKLVVRLGFHPSLSNTRVQISRKEEVSRIVALLKFREY